MNWFIIFPALIYSTVKSCKKKKFDKGTLDEGGPMTYNVRNPLNKVFQRPDFSVEEFRKRIQQQHSQNKEIQIRKAPPITRKIKPTLLENLPDIGQKLRK